MATEIDIEILSDGVVKATTSKIADSLHVEADNLLDELESMLGGIRKTEANPETEGKQFFRNRVVKRGGKIVKMGN